MSLPEHPIDTYFQVWLDQQPDEAPFDKMKFYKWMAERLSAVETENQQLREKTRSIAYFQVWSDQQPDEAPYDSMKFYKWLATRLAEVEAEVTRLRGQLCTAHAWPGQT